MDGARRSDRSRSSERSGRSSPLDILWLRAPGYSLLLCRHHRNGHLGDHLGMELDADRMLAAGLAATLEIDAPAVDGEALLFQQLRHVAGGHRAVESAGVADPLGDLEPQAGELGGDLGRGV